MKKNYLLLCFSIMMASLPFHAQVVNGNFENIKPNFLPSNWGMNLNIPVVFDPQTGQSTSDTIQYPWCIPALCFASLDPQSGMYAMEIGNAFNQTTNQVIPGQAMIFSDETQDSPGWNAGVGITPGTTVSILGFYYKFFPVENDVAEAIITVFDADGNEIGTGSIDITSTATDDQFHYLNTTINYVSNATPAFMYISFNMAKEGTTAHFGSRLVVDNVVTDPQALSLDVQPISVNTDFVVYPTLVSTELSIVPAATANGMIKYTIYDGKGKSVKQVTVLNESTYVYNMNVAELATGSYYLLIESNLGKTTKRFIKR